MQYLPMFMNQNQLQQLKPVTGILLCVGMNRVMLTMGLVAVRSGITVIFRDGDPSLPPPRIAL